MLFRARDVEWHGEYRDLLRTVQHRRSDGHLFTFQPASVHVKAGGSVAWVNCEPTAIPHTSTSDGSGWNSGSLAPAAAFVRAFPAAGNFPYHCDIHPSMKATVIVD